MPESSGLARLPDLVRDTELKTDVNNGITRHTYYVSDTRTYRRAEVKHTRWKREAKIGDGGFGTVYVERRLDKSEEDEPELRAVKRIRHGTSQKLWRELEAMAKFSQARYEHCFVKSHGWFEWDDSLHIVMEYVKLQDLQRTMSGMQALTELDAATVSSQILEGLEFMHDNAFAHRDLKPKNILVMARPPDPWWVKIADFGISKRLEDAGETSSAIKGSLQFMAPELLIQGNSTDQRADSAIDYFKADIWAVGCIVYYMIAAKVPFPTLKATIAYAQGSSEHPILRLGEQTVTIEGRDFLQGLLMVDPAQRPSGGRSRQHPLIRGTTETEAAHYPQLVGQEFTADVMDTDLDPILRTMDLSLSMETMDHSANWTTVDEVSKKKAVQDREVRKGWRTPPPPSQLPPRPATVAHPLHRPDQMEGQHVQESQAERILLTPPSLLQRSSTNPTAPNYRWWIPADGIRRDGISAEIQRYLGPDALVRPGEHEGRQVYWISACRTLTPAMIKDLQQKSAKFASTGLPEVLSQIYAAQGLRADYAKHQGLAAQRETLDKPSHSGPHVADIHDPRAPSSSGSHIPLVNKRSLSSFPPAPAGYLLASDGQYYPLKDKPSSSSPPSTVAGPGKLARQQFPPPSYFLASDGSYYPLKGKPSSSSLPSTVDVPGQLVRRPSALAGYYLASDGKYYSESSRPT